MKIMRQVFLLVLMAGLGCLEVYGQSTNRIPEAMVTIKVTDEVGGVLTGMPIHIWFDESVIFDGVTDSSGFYVARGKCSIIDPPIRIERKGYYISSMKCRFTNILDKVEYQWQPWNPVVTMVVRRVINPVPMYEKRVETKIPRTNEFFGFDLMRGDWVAPQGQGVVSDLIFKVEGFWKDYRNTDTTLSLRFHQPKDGLLPFAYPVAFGMPIGSEFIIPREAPLDGYESELVKRKSRFQGKDRDVQINDFSEGKGYIFRIRSVTNDSGMVTTAYYGGMLRDIEFGGAGKNGSSLKFTYFLNPAPNDRNLEFDPKQNLFKGQ